MARLKLIPWEPSWLSHQTLDLHAIYRRPVRDPNTWKIARDEEGLVTWDLTSPLPIRSHVRHMQKGFEYVTLATAQDVIEASKPALSTKGATPLGAPGRPEGEHADLYLRQPGIRGPWDPAAYLADMEDERQQRIARVRANVERYGPDGAEAFEREKDPDFVLPEKYRATAPDDAVPEAQKRRGRPPKAQPVAEAEESL